MTVEPGRNGRRLSRAQGLMLSLSVRMYRALAAVRYPRGLRARYGSRMVEDVRCMLAEGMGSRGLAGLGATWWRVLRDLASRVPAPVAPDDRSPSDGTSATSPSPPRWSALGVLEDAGFALRSLRRELRFTLLVVGVLSVAIALNVAAFSVVRAYLLRPLPYPHADRLVAVTAWGAVSWTEVEEVLDLAVSWDLDVFTLVDGDRPGLVRGAWVTPDFLPAYGVEAALGRSFAADEAGADGAAVAMISDRLWRERFGASSDVIGRAFRAYVSDRPEEAELFTVVGVLPADFWYLNGYTDVLAPLRGDRPLYTGRLGPGVTLEQAEEHLTRIAVPRLESPPPDFRVTLEPLQAQYVAAVRPTLTVVQIAVALVLVIAFANTIVLLLLRAARREREVAVRRALGASHLRIARQMLAEGLMLSGAAGLVASGGAGVALAAQGALVQARLGRGVPGGLDALTPDAAVIGATVAGCLVLGVALGAGSMLSLRGRRSTSAMRGAGAGLDVRRRHARDALVTAELALSLALLTGAGLMVRSALHLQARPLGFDPEGVTTGAVGLRESSYPTPEARQRFFDRLTDGVARLPAVSAVAVAQQVPFGGMGAPKLAEGQDAAPSTEVVTSVVGEGFFSTLDIALLQGRDFDREDRWGGEPVAIVTRSLAEALWPGGDALGRRVRIRPLPTPDEATPEPGPFRRVVAVADDVESGVGTNALPTLYLSARQAPALWMDLVTRVAPGAPPVVPEIESVLRGLDPEVPFSEVGELSTAVAAARAPTRFLATLLGGFSAFAFLLAVLGLYGVISYAARQSQREIAIRMALGADRGRVVARFVSSGLAVAATGVAIGSVAGFFLGRALEGHLYGVSPGDPLTQGGLALVLLTASWVAVWWPARRAAGADPGSILRAE